MVVGLAAVASVVQMGLEKWVLHIIMWGKLRKLKPLVRKGLSAHRDRNRKTALMFTTVVAFMYLFPPSLVISILAYNSWLLQYLFIYCVLLADQRSISRYQSTERI